MKLLHFLGFCFFLWGTQAAAQVTKKPVKAKVSVVANANENLRNWALRNLKIQLPTRVGKAVIPQNIKYNADLTPEILQELTSEWWLGPDGITKPVFEYFSGYLSMRYSLDDDGVIKWLLLNNHYMVLSYHLSAGSEGDALLIDLETMKMEHLSGYNVGKFKSEHVLYVDKDYYDDQGHVWEVGEYNIVTGAYKFLSKDH